MYQYVLFLVQPKSGLLQSSIISLFLSYITLTSLANEPYDLGMWFLKSYNIL
jgi:hypothetical protein